jgi:RNA polymerase sigma factor (sigma-70 family)
LCAIGPLNGTKPTAVGTKIINPNFVYMSDSELLARFAEPSTRSGAFRELVEKYQQKVYWHIRKMVIDHDDADDLTQDTFVRVWRGLEGFRSDSQLYTWIYRIATNECLAFLKKKKRRFFIPIDNLEEQFSAQLDSDPLVDGDAIAILLQKILLTLPEKQRLVFNMKYFDEMTYEEISAVTGTSVGALKASYHFAVKKIEDALKANESTDRP